MFGKPTQVVHANDQASNQTVIAKEVALAQKDIDIARGRGILLADIFEYDLLKENPLFSGDFPQKTQKSVLVTELEKKLIGQDCSISKISELDTVLIIDFMSIIRRMPFNSTIGTFGNSLSACRHAHSNSLT